jgi:hypothetical protein
MNRLRRLWSRLREQNPTWVLALTAVLFVVGTGYFFTVTVPKHHHTTQRISGDGRYYYAFLTSIALDGDVDFANQYANPRQGNPWGYKHTQAGKPANAFTVGPALLWMPFFALAHAVSLASEPATEAKDGYSDRTQMLTLYGSFLYGCAAAWLCYRLARRRFGPGPAFIGAIVALTCGPVLQYLVHQPSFAHGPSAFAVTLLLYVWDTGRGEEPGARSVRGWAALGACLGLAMLVRQQNLVFGLPLVIEGAWRVVRGARAGVLGARAGFRGAASAAVAPAVGAAAALVVFMPQILVWQSIYGFALGIAQGGGYMQWGEPAWSEVLFSSRNGLFVFAPLWLLGLIGLGLFARRERLTAGLLLGSFVLVTWVNGAVTDWWAIGSVGARRFDGLLVPVTLGIAFVALRAIDLVERRPRAVATAATLLVVLGAGRLNFRLIDRFTRIERFGEPESRDTRAMWLQTIDAETKPLWQWGNPVSWPAALSFSAKTGLSPKRYDDVVGPYLLHGYAINDFQTRPEKETGALAFTSPKHERFLVSGFGEVEKRNDQARGPEELRVALGPRARALVPLNNQGDVAAHLLGEAVAAGTLRVRWNGKVVAETPLAPGQPIDVSVILTDATTIRGLNQLELVHEGVPAGAKAALYRRLELRSPP